MNRKQEINNQITDKAFFKRLIIAALVPIFIAAAFSIGILVSGLFRYDSGFFTDDHKEQYISPGTIAIELESALREGNIHKYQELTGLRKEIKTLETNPDLILSILIEVDDQGYFHYMYFDKQTYRRNTQYIHEVDGRWVVTPMDAHYLFFSGQWLRAFFPILTIWWIILFVVLIGKLVMQKTQNSRIALGY